MRNFCTKFSAFSFLGHITLLSPLVHSFCSVNYFFFSFLFYCLFFSFNVLCSDFRGCNLFLNLLGDALNDGAISYLQACLVDMQKHTATGLAGHSVCLHAEVAQSCSSSPSCNCLESELSAGLDFGPIAPSQGHCLSLAIGRKHRA